MLFRSLLQAWLEPATLPQWQRIDAVGWLLCDVKWLLRVSERWLRVGDQLVTAGRRRAAGARANGSVYGFMCVWVFM